jgi:hypothetical protein
MKNYLLLYFGGNMPATQAEQAATLKAWEGWFGQLGAAVVSAGDPFGPQVKSLASDGKVSEGPVGTLATGYSIIKADSLDAAVALAKGCPHLKAGGRISVYETFSVM